MKALITGITGFAGSHLAEALLAAGDQVLGISRQLANGQRVLPELPLAISMMHWIVRMRWSEHIVLKVAARRWLDFQLAPHTSLFEESRWLPTVKPQPAAYRWIRALDSVR